MQLFWLKKRDLYGTKLHHICSTPTLRRCINWGMFVRKESGLYSRHGLVYGLHTKTHGKLIHDLLRHVIKVNFPGIITLDLRDLHDSAVLHLRQVVKEILYGSQEHKRVITVFKSINERDRRRWSGTPQGFRSTVHEMFKHVQKLLQIQKNQYKTRLMESRNIFNGLFFLLSLTGAFTDKK